MTLISSVASGSGHEECVKENVHSFPTLRFFGPEGNMADFDGPRTVDQLVTFAKQHTGIEPMPTPEEAAAGTTFPAMHVHFFNVVVPRKNTFCITIINRIQSLSRPC